MNIESGLAASSEPHASAPKTGFWILAGVLAVSGIAMAVIVFLGLTESKAFGLVGLVFLADIYLIISLAARHAWLQRTIWVGTALTFVLGVIVNFWPEDEYYIGANDPNVMSYDDLDRTPYGMLSDITFAAHTVLGTLLALGLISMAWRWIKHERMLRAVYVFMFVTGIGAGLFWAVGYVTQHSDGLIPLQLGITILALTAAAIVIIAGFVQRNAQQSLAQTQQGTLAAAAGHSHESEDLRATVRRYVDEYLEERGR